MPDGVAVLQPDGSNVRGVVRFIDETGGLRIPYRVTGLTNGEHGFHIHEYGDLTDGCKSACSHFNPDGKTHGGLDTAVRHFGDLGNITSSNGVAEGELFLANAKLDTSRYGILGRMIIVHADRDDLGMGGDEESLKTGNAGKRLACGVIGLADPDTDTMTMDAESTYLATLGVGMAAAGLGFIAGRRDSRTLKAPYQPNQEISDYNARDLATSSAITGDFTTDSLKYGFGPTSLSAEDNYDSTYGKEQAKIRRRLKNKLMGEATMGTKAGQWSARKSQELKRRYEAACERKGIKPYKGSKTTKQKDLSDWSKQGWRTASGRKSSVTGEPYFPTKAVKALKDKELYAKAKRQKAAATRAGKQRATYSKDIQAVVARYRAEDHTIDDLDSDSLVNRMDAIGILLDEIVQKHGGSYEKAERDPIYLRLVGEHTALARAYARREGFGAESEQFNGELEEQAYGDVDDSFTSMPNLSHISLPDYEESYYWTSADGNSRATVAYDDDNMVIVIPNFEVSLRMRGKKLAHKYLEELIDDAYLDGYAVQVTDVDDHAIGFWKKMQNQGLINGWSKGSFAAEDDDEVCGNCKTTREERSVLPHRLSRGETKATRKLGLCYDCGGCYDCCWLVCEPDDVRDDHGFEAESDASFTPDPDLPLTEQARDQYMFMMPDGSALWIHNQDWSISMADMKPTWDSKRLSDYGGTPTTVTYMSLGSVDSADYTDFIPEWRSGMSFPPEDMVDQWIDPSRLGEAHNEFTKQYETGFWPGLSLREILGKYDGGKPVFGAESDPVSSVAAGTTDALNDFANSQDTDDKFYFLGGLVGGLAIAVLGNIISDRLQDVYFPHWWENRGGSQS